MPSNYCYFLSELPITIDIIYSARLTWGLAATVTDQTVCCAASSKNHGYKVKHKAKSIQNLFQNLFLESLTYTETGGICSEPQRIGMLFPNMTCFLSSYEVWFKMSTRNFVIYGFPLRYNCYLEINKLHKTQLMVSSIPIQKKPLSS